MTRRVDLGALLARWREAVPAIAMLSAVVVVGVAFAALFVLPGAQSSWITPLLLLAAAGGGFALRNAGSVPAVAASAVPAAATTPVATDAEARVRELSAELDKLRHMQAELMHAKQTAE